MRLLRTGKEPLVDLRLYRIRGFTMGVVLAAMTIFGIFGLLFTLPQYWQGVLGLDAQVSGFRFLPAIFGMVVGALPADRVAARFGHKAVIAFGLAILAVAQWVGAMATAESGVAFEAA
jgi:MFS family permease